MRLLKRFSCLRPLLLVLFMGLCFTSPILAITYGGITSEKTIGLGFSNAVLTIQNVNKSSLDIAIGATTTGNITNFIGNPTNTSIILSWQKAVGTTNTSIVYRTDTYPLSATDGTAVYTGSAYQTTAYNLTAGQTYYFAAYGGVTGNFTSPPAYLAMSTPAVGAPSGAATEPTFNPTSPTLSATMGQDPSITDYGFNLFPFNIAVKYFATQGLGMPLANAVEWLVALGITVVGMVTYTKVRNFFVAYSMVFVLTIISIGLHFMQGWIIFPMLIIGGGVWMIERYMQ